MKMFVLLLAFIAPLVCQCQNYVGVEVYRNGVDIVDKRLEFRSKEAYSAGIWHEHVFGEAGAFGIKTNLMYTQRRARFEDVDLKNDVVVLGMMARLHDQDMNVRWLRVVGGLGLYGQFPNSDDFFELMDMGMTFEVGLDFKYLVLSGNIQTSFLDVTQLPKWQRWMSFGVGLQVPVFKGK